MATCFTTIESKLPRAHLSRRLRNTVRPEYKLPRNFRAANIPELEIPSKAFCESQAIKPSDHYLVLPWWYQFCASYMEKELGPYRKGKYFIPLYRRVLDQALQYKKFKQELQQKVNSFKIE